MLDVFSNDAWGIVPLADALKKIPYKPTRLGPGGMALFNEQGVRGGRVGIAPVAPDRLPEPLPPGLNFPLVITVQTDGPQNFDQPVPICLPNLPDPATPTG